MTKDQSGKGWEALTADAKRRIRQNMRGIRQALSPERVSLRSQTIMERLWLHPWLQQAHGVALYYPIAQRCEVDLRSLHEKLAERGVRLFYPFMQPEPDGTRLTGFRRADVLSELAEQGQRFLEPPPSAPQALRGDIDVVVVPALAVADNGHRLGYGAGFYDATLPDICPPAHSIVVAYDFQVLLELPVWSSDWACDAVITDASGQSRV
jgi:5-formyltetrahydrofolate cyclo-ligase